MNGSSSTGQPFQSPHSTTPPSYSQQSNFMPGTSNEIKAHGDIKVKVGVLWLVGVICFTLSIFGCVSFVMVPDKSKDLWVIIGPIISASMTGTVAFLTGEKYGTKSDT